MVTRMTEPDATAGARVLALAGAAGATLALGLPWVRELDKIKVTGVTEEVSTGDDVVWTGWTLGGASRLDGHRPVSLIVAVLLVAGTLALLAGCWLAFESERRWLALSTIGLAAVLLIASFPLLSGVPGTYGLGHPTDRDFGVVVWRTSVFLALLGTLRIGVLRESAARATR